MAREYLFPVPSRVVSGAVHHNRADRRGAADRASGMAASDKAPLDGMEPGKAWAMWAVSGKVRLVAAASGRASQGAYRSDDPDKGLSHRYNKVD